MNCSCEEHSINMIRKLTVKNEVEMRLIAAELAKTAFAGEFIALFGDLGAGKTTLVRYFAEKLGADTAASPTFTIVRHYTGNELSIDHFDCYRLADSDELFAIGFDDYLDSPSVKLMEWSENVSDALPQSRLEVHISGSGCDPRQIELIPFGDEYERIAEELEL